MDEAKAWAAEIAEQSPTALSFLKASFNADTEHQGGIGEMANGGLDLFMNSEEGARVRGRSRRSADPTPPRFAHRMAVIDIGGKDRCVTGAASGDQRRTMHHDTGRGRRDGGRRRPATPMVDRTTAEQIEVSAHAADLADPAAVDALRDEVIETHGVPRAVHHELHRPRTASSGLHRGARR